ncbi:MAG: hypothetical protein H6730_22480 [Deltaproteobacteria bacterium]|nr:hypothetical protein [Deltaproteobacteria bacterium]
MALRATLSAGLCAAAAALAAAAPASACPPALPGFNDFRPVDGTRVPANAVLLVEGVEFRPFDGSFMDGDQEVVLLPADLGPLGELLLHPAADAADPEHLVVKVDHRGGLDIEPLYVSLSVDPEAHDLEGPIVPRQATLHAQWRDPDPGLCEPGGWVVTYRTPAARDDFGVLAYQLLVGRDGAPAEAALTQLAPLDPTEHVVLVHHAGFEPAQLCYQLLAVDMAAHQSLGEQVDCITLDAPVLDAGFADAGFEDAGLADGGDRGSGQRWWGEDCGCDSTGGRGGVLGGVLLLGLALLARPRRG